MVGDKLYFYFSARAGIKGSKASGACTTGLAILRRDGFASMDAGETEGTLTTRPVQFNGKHLFVNLDAKQGELRVEAIDAQGKPIAPFTKENCEPLATDATLAAVRWRGAEDLSALAGKPVSLRFHLTNGRLYSFWVSPDVSGASHGYVAAGGPGFTTPARHGRRGGLRSGEEDSMISGRTGIANRPSRGARQNQNGWRTCRNGLSRMRLAFFSRTASVRISLLFPIRGHFPYLIEHAAGDLLQQIEVVDLFPFQFGDGVALLGSQFGLQFFVRPIDRGAQFLKFLV